MACEFIRIGGITSYGPISIVLLHRDLTLHMQLLFELYIFLQEYHKLDRREGNLNEERVDTLSTIPFLFKSRSETLFASSSSEKYADEIIVVPLFTRTSKLYVF